MDLLDPRRDRQWRARFPRASEGMQLVATSWRGGCDAIARKPDSSAQSSRSARNFPPFIRRGSGAVDLSNPRQMSPAFEFRLQPNADNRQRLRFGDGSLA